MYCVYTVSFFFFFLWRESKFIEYSLHRCLSDLLKQCCNITALITFLPVSLCQKMSDHPSIYFCYIHFYFLLSLEIWILVIGLSGKAKSMTVCCQCDTEYLTGNTASFTFVLSNCHVVCLHSNELWRSGGMILEVIYRHSYFSSLLV